MTDSDLLNFPPDPESSALLILSSKFLDIMCSLCSHKLNISSPRAPVPRASSPTGYVDIFLAGKKLKYKESTGTDI